MKSTDRTRRNRLKALIGDEKYTFLMLINPFEEDGLSIPEACEQMGVSRMTGTRWLDEIDQIVPGTKEAVQSQQAINTELNRLDHDIKHAENQVGISRNYTPGIQSLNDNDQIARKF